MKRVCHKMGVILWILLVISLRWRTLKANNFNVSSNLTLAEDQYSKYSVENSYRPVAGGFLF